MNGAGTSRKPAEPSTGPNTYGPMRKCSVRSRWRSVGQFILDNTKGKICRARAA